MQILFINDSSNWLNLILRNKTCNLKNFFHHQSFFLPKKHIRIMYTEKSCKYLCKKQTYQNFKVLIHNFLISSHESQFAFFPCLNFIQSFFLLLCYSITVRIRKRWKNGGKFLFYISIILFSLLKLQFENLLPLICFFCSPNDFSFLLSIPSYV